MRNYIIKRILHLIPTLIGVSIITFFLIRLAPGDPATAILGIEATPDKIEYINNQYGLNKPLPIQYLNWMGRILHFDLGKSIVYSEEIINLILARIPVTFQLAFAAMVVSLAISIPVGIISAVKKDTLFDNLGRFLAFAGISTPNFWLGLLLLYLFAVTIPVLPLFGYESIISDPVEGFKHLLLPAVTLGTALAAMVTRLTRSCMLEVLNEDFIVTARAKGLSERVVISKHALKNALIPVITVVGLQLGFIMGGSVLTEVVFALPGMGRLMVDSIFHRDYPVVQAIVLVYALTFVLINLLVDLCYAYLDPRIKYN